MKETEESQGLIGGKFFEWFCENMYGNDPEYAQQKAKEAFIAGYNSRLSTILTEIEELNPRLIIDEAYDDPKIHHYLEKEDVKSIIQQHLNQ